METGQAGTGQPGYLQEEPSGPGPTGAGPVRGLAAVVVVLLVTALATVAVHKPDHGGARLGVGRPAPIALASAAAALRVHTVRLHMSVSVAITNQGRATSVDLAGDGVVDYASRTTQMNMAFSMAGAGPQIHATEELRVLGGYVYLRFPDGFPGIRLPAGKLWLRQPAPSPFVNAGPNDPSQAIDQLRSVARDLSVIGTETVNGVEATHYSANVRLADTPAWAALQAHNSALANNPFVQALARQPFRMDAWIDAEGRLRRLAETIHFQFAGLVPNAGPGDADDTHITIDFLDYGAPVAVQPPPAGQVADQPIPGLAGNPVPTR